jgi:penicillin-binding protein 1A
MAKKASKSLFNRFVNVLWNRQVHRPDELGKVKQMWLIYAAFLVFIVVFFAAVSWGVFGPMPSFEELENPKSKLASEIISVDGKVLGTYYIENRSNVRYSDLSPALIEALVSTEDARFYDHSGIDMRAMFRVAAGVFTGGKGGGSTLTQQLAKNLFPRGENLNFVGLVFRKFKEWVLAVKLERNYTKEELLAMYLNTIDFGSQAFGIKSGAQTFFGKKPSELTAEEAALFVAILNAPSWYSPVRHPDRALERRNLVLNQMNKYGYIDEVVLDSLKQIPLDMSKYGRMDHTQGLATYLRELLRNELKDWCNTHFKSDGSPYNIYKDGLKIYTTIDSRMQEYAEYAVRKHMKEELQPAFFKHWKGAKNAPFSRDLSKAEINKIYDDAMKRSDRYIRMRQAGMSKDSIRKAFQTPVEMRVFSYKGEIDTVMSPMDSIRYHMFYLHAGLISIDSRTGAVRAYVGGIDYKYFQYDHVKMSQRQVGSTFKPFLYALAMQEGEYSPCSKVPNIPVVFDLPEGGTWAPRNSDDKREGEMVTLKWALANSVNYISAYLMKRYQPDAVIKMARKMGITADIPSVPSICLGTPDISPYEMTAAFNTFANKGVYVEPVMITRIEDKSGNVIERFTSRKEEAMSEETAYLMLDLMKGVVNSGTGVRIRYKYKIEYPVAGKTGTTQNNSDGWFIGITPDLTTGVWVGGEVRSIHFRSITLGQGASMALPIWAYYMQKVYADQRLGVSKEDFELPRVPLSVDLNCSGADDESVEQNFDLDEF